MYLHWRVLQESVDLHSFEARDTTVVYICTLYFVSQNAGKRTVHKGMNGPTHCNWKLTLPLKLNIPQAGCHS